MRSTIAVAQSRDRIAITAVEAIDVKDQRSPLMAVTFADRLKPDSTPAEQRAAVLRISAAIEDEGRGTEPRIVVSYGFTGTTLVELLREDFRQGRRGRRPTAVTSVAALADGRAEHVSRNILAATLYREWVENRIKFASDLPGIDRLRSQMGGFVPRETTTGTLTFGDETLADYDDQVVSLMFGVLVRGYGEPRFLDGEGRLWPSRLVALGHIGSAASNSGRTTTSTSFGTETR